jgi:hypothetical protein
VLLFGRNRESRTREAAGRSNWPEALPGRNERQKKAGLLNWEDNVTRAVVRGQLERNKKRSAIVHQR